MKTWESGRESELLDDIIAGRKTIEGRLNRGKFSDYNLGDIVKLRRDHRDSGGVLHEGEADVVRVRIVAIRQYSSFLDMVSAEGYKRVIPLAKSACEAADIYNRYYSLQDQRDYGVLAIEISVI